VLLRPAIGGHDLDTERLLQDASSMTFGFRDRSRNESRTVFS
jgi:hypothetical protein